MKNIILVLSVFLIYASFVPAQTISWLSQQPGSAGSTSYRAVTYDNSSYSYQTGLYNNSTLAGCNGSIPFTSFKPDGTIQFTNAYQPPINNGICDEEGNAILYDSNSGKIIVGGRENAEAFLGYFDAATGNFSFKASISSSGSLSAIKGLHLSGSQIYAVGYFRNSITFGGTSPITLNGAAQYNVFVAKFDLSGNVLQAISGTSASNASAIGFDITEDTNGKVYISVAAKNSITFGGSQTYNLSGGAYKIVLVELDGSFGFLSGTVVSTSPYTIGVEAELPLQMDWNGTSLIIGGIHQDQKKSFLANFALSSGSPVAQYTQNLNRIIRDVAVDCSHIYITGYKGYAANSVSQKRSAPCNSTHFLFFDTHDIASGNQLVTKQASGCTFGEGVAVDQEDNIWINGTFRDPSNMTFESLSQNFTFAGSNGLASQLTADSSCIKEARFCCPGDNLVVNGDFEGGNTGFTNNAIHQPTIATHSILPGQFGIVNGAQAATVSSTWANVQDPASCTSSAGNFMVVNGETGNLSTPQKLIWEQTVWVNDWKGFKFCMKAKNLDQCGFNVTPKIDIVFSIPQIGNITETVSVNTSNPCDWQSIEKGFNLWGYGSTLNIKIILHQAQAGDGNDIAIDDIALIELPQAGSPLVSFTVGSPVDLGGGFYSLTATPNPLPDGCYFAWEVCELDNTNTCINTTKVYNPSQWWSSLSTNFAGYNGSSTLSGSNPGQFSYSKKYRITRGAWCECESWNQYSVDIEPTRRAIIFSDSETDKVIMSSRIKSTLSKKPTGKRR